MDFAKLAEPFDPERIEWRIGATNKDKTSGMAFAYMDARDVMDRLDQVCGPENWQCRYSHADNKTVCDIGIRIGDDWVWKADGSGDSDTEAEKGALSGAFKRAAVRWGIGRYLYDVPTPWVAIEQRGKSYVIANKNDPKLARALGQTTDTGTGRRVPDGEVNSPADFEWMPKLYSIEAAIKQFETEGELTAYIRLQDYQEFKNNPEVPKVLKDQLEETARGKMRGLRAAEQVNSEAA